MARASTPTLLALDRYAKILGLNPAWFNQGVSDVVFPLANACADLIFQNSYQNYNAVSREDIAREIANAEKQLADYLGWPVAPMWIAQDVKMHPRFHRPDYWQTGSYNARFAPKGIKTKYGKIIEPGQRATDEVEKRVIPVFSDEDGDGFDETVTVTCATTLDEAGEIKVYFAGHNGLPEWEIRPERTKYILTGVFTATFWAWQFIDPDNWEAFPTAARPTPTVDLDEAVYVNEVEVYREYNDPTAVSARLYWEPVGSCEFCGGTGCTHCALTTQDGCAHIRDAELGVLVPRPGTYDSDECAWTSDDWAVCRDPDQVKLYYYCGNLSDLNLASRRCDGLSDEWARIIAWMATARLPRPICTCGSPGGLVEWLQQDLAMNTREASHTILWEELANPFGTRNGEMAAWRYVRDIVRDKQAWAGAV
jgi:hypothetical protein